MGINEILTDDYVAELLESDARDCSIKHSAMGLEAYRTVSKRPADAPKPNMRFLRNIIRDADSHNTALLAKEAAESRARLEVLEVADERARQRRNPGAGDIRCRQVGSINAILEGKLRRRGTGKREAHERDAGGRDTRDQDGRRRSERHANSDGRRRDGSEDDGRLHHEHSTRSRRKHRRSRSSEDSDRVRGRRRRHHRRSCSPRARPRSRSPHPHPHPHRTTHRDRSSPRRNKSPSQRCPPESNEDVDPLEEFIGPAPPPKPRGRGVVSSYSGIDRRFSADYDPKSDVALDDVDDAAVRNDWDGALEALKDRRQWRQSQPERLRAAGFGDDVIQKLGGADAWLAASAEGETEEVRWTKRGEIREWDLHKATELADFESGGQ